MHASSVGVYSPGPKDRAVDESWPRAGISTSFYSRHKAAAERALDDIEALRPDWRVVRLRLGLIFQRDAGPEIPAACWPARSSPPGCCPCCRCRGDSSCRLCTPTTSARRIGSPPSHRRRALADLTRRPRLQPSPAGWVDMGPGVPVLDTRRAREELGWTPRHSAAAALLEMLEGMRTASGGPTPPLDARAGGRLRLGELRTGVGARP